MKSNFELMASYNQLMNQQIYSVADALSPVELNKDRGAFFGSTLGTLNHILVGDIIWLKRFANHPNSFASLNDVRDLKAPSALNVILYPTLGALVQIRAEMDKTIISFTAELTQESIASSLNYKSVQGVEFNKGFGFLLQHFFNHQTHHRGQVSTLLHQAGVAVGVTDLLVSIADE